jgi:L-glyceraldehyde 3-phosphate reductase
MFDRWVEDGLLDVLDEEGVGGIVFCPLAQGLLTDKYLNSVPEDSRAANPHGFLKRDHITEDKRAKVAALNSLAKQRGQTLAQLALAWVLRRPTVTSALIGASRVGQIDDCVGALENRDISREEVDAIDNILAATG